MKPRTRADLWHARLGRHHAATAPMAFMIGNILDAYDRREPADEQPWYRRANAFARHIARIYKVSVPVAAGVIAALSPGNPWEQNQRDAAGLLFAARTGYGASAVPTSTYPVAREKALRILETPRAERETVLAQFSPRTAPKTRRFFLCILEPDNPWHVCIDSHAYGVAVGKRYTNKTTPTITPADYDRIATAYRVAAALAGILPLEMQATTWSVHRRDN